MAQAATAPRSPSDLQEWALARFLFRDGKIAPFIWLVVRLYLGWQWLDAGRGKVFGENSAVWVGDKAGVAIQGFIKGALAKTTGEHPEVQDWYATFLKDVVSPNAAFFSWLVAVGELAVGLGLIVGCLTGIAAFFGIVMNANYLLAGTSSTNPVLSILAIFIILAWRNAGWIGIDRFLLPALGTPWQPGGLFRRGAKPASS